MQNTYNDRYEYAYTCLTYENTESSVNSIVYVK